MLNHFDEPIQLRTVTETITNGYPTQIVTSRSVWAERKTAKRAEFYSALAVNVRADVVFVVNIIDYENEQEIECGGEIYDVIRTYQNTLDHIELTCQRRE